MRTTFLALLIFATPTIAAADGISLEADPLPFILSGYDVVVGYQPDFAPRARVIASTHSFELPNALLGDDWHSDMRGVTLHGQYFFRGEGRGWMVGSQLAYAHQTFTRDSAPGMSADLSQLDVAVIGGYRWFPFDKGLFLVGWMKVGLPIELASDDMLGG